MSSDISSSPTFLERSAAACSSSGDCQPPRRRITNVSMWALLLETVCDAPYARRAAHFNANLLVPASGPDAVGRVAQRGDVQLAHLEHRVHRAPGPLRVRVREQLLHAGRHDLPRQPVAVLEPAARPLLTALGQPLPVVVDLVLVHAGDLEGDGLVKGELRTAVDAD